MMLLNGWRGTRSSREFIGITELRFNHNFFSKSSFLKAIGPGSKVNAVFHSKHFHLLDFLITLILTIRLQLISFYSQSSADRSSPPKAKTRMMTSNQPPPPNQQPAKMNVNNSGPAGASGENMNNRNNQIKAMFSRNSSPATSSAAAAALKNVTTTGTFIQVKNIRNEPQALMPDIMFLVEKLFWWLIISLGCRIEGQRVGAWSDAMQC